LVEANPTRHSTIEATGDPAQGAAAPPSDEPSADQPPDPALDALAQHLRDLGAETPAERRAKRVIPWVGSVFLHAGLIVVGFLAVFAVRVLPDDEPLQVVADWTQLNYQPLASRERVQDQEDRPRTQDRTRTENLADALDEQLRELEVDATQLLSDGASSQQLADFAPQPRQGTARFAGLTGTNARTIVFVVDASGSMIGTLQIVVEELARSIDGLSPQQEFGVIFFQHNKALVTPPESRLTPALPDEKIRAIEWIDRNVLPAGRSNPLAAIEKALSFEPDLVFVLSNNITGSGVFEIDQADLLETLDRLNPVDPEIGRRRTQIQCVQFLDPDPLDTLRLIAEAHGGPNGYRFLSRIDLGLGGG